MDNKLIDAAGFFNDKKWDDLAGDWYKNFASFLSQDTLEVIFMNKQPMVIILP